MITSTSVWRAGLIATLMAVPGVHAAQVADVHVADSVKVGNSELVLNGAGLRSKLFIKVYVGALYVGQKATTPAAIYDSPAPRRMVLRLLRDLDAESLYAALDEGLRNNHTPTELQAMQAQISQLAEIMKAIGKVRDGDSVSIDFAGDGVSIAVNEAVRGRVAGSAFAKALLKVWLGDKPADAALKKALLGG